MKITYDKIANAMYIYFRKGNTSKTIEIGQDFLADVDKNGRILGLEILNASQNLSKSDQGKNGKNITKPSIIIGNKSIRLPVLVH